MSMDIVIPVYEDFTALDAIGPYEVLSRLGQVRFVAREAGPVRTDTGMLSVVAEASLDEVTSCDVLVVPGGPDVLAAARRDPELPGWLAAVHATTTWTTSVCTGSLLLGAAGLLDGLPATSHWTALEVLADSFGAGPVGGRVVEAGGDSRIVTAAGVSAGIDMALWLAARLAGDQTARAIQLGIEYDPQPPFDSGSPETADPALVAAIRGGLAAAS
jgi:putative intracellular protease/amidase